MKIAAATLMMIFGISVHAESIEQAPIDSVNLDSQNMDVTMNVTLSNPCDRIVPPQIVQDAENPAVLKVQGMAKKASGLCITRVADATQVVNLPALVEMSQLKIAKGQTYVVQFEGFDGELVVPGDKLMISIQPQPITE